MPDENITAPTTSHFSLNPPLSYFGTETRVEFKGSCLKQDKTTYDHVKIAFTYIVYEINKNFKIRSYPTLENCSLDAVSLIKDADFDKYKYSGYGIRFDRQRFLTPLWWN